jgi:hypothetical protein
LGSQPCDPEIREKFLIEKARKAGSLDANVSENEDLPTNIEDDKQLTVFMRDNRNSGQLYISSYVIKGFMKEALKALSYQTASPSGLPLKNPAGKIDNLVFINPNKLLLSRQSGDPVITPDGIFQRPLRAETMQGPRVSLSASEYLDDWSLDFEILLVSNNGTKASSGISWRHIEIALNYGRFKGLGQWRNAGNGSFSFSVL